MALNVYEENYCMILSKYRLCQGLALYYSLMNSAAMIHIYILSVDEETNSALRKLAYKNITVVSVDQLKENALMELKQDRELCEYCWTMKPVFMQYIINTYTNIKRITYLDADIFFYSEPDAIFPHIEPYSALLSSHNYSRKYKYLEKYCGKFNSGIISFGCCDEAKSAISWWKQQCMNWCSKGFTKSQFGDQKYLEQMPQLFQRVSSIQRDGVNIAPWNHSCCSFYLRNKSVYVNDSKLICYHFSGLRLINNREFVSNFAQEKKIDSTLYKPYLEAIDFAISELEALDDDFEKTFIEKINYGYLPVYKINMFVKSV